MPTVDLPAQGRGPVASDWAGVPGSDRSALAPRASLTRTGATTWPVAAFRVAFGLVWAIDAVLKWLPGFRDTFGAMLEATAQGQPAWLRPWFDLWTGLSHDQTLGLAYAAAATETFLALALLVGFARKCTYLLGAGYSLMIWGVAEGFGGPYQSGATDIGTGIIYTFVFVALLLASRAGPDPYSLDSFLESRISWWYRVAEVGRHRR